VLNAHDASRDAADILVLVAEAHVPALHPKAGVHIASRVEAVHDLPGSRRVRLAVVTAALIGAQLRKFGTHLHCFAGLVGQRKELGNLRVLHGAIARYSLAPSVACNVQPR
jgi:hypothetical protein